MWKNGDPYAMAKWWSAFIGKMWLPVNSTMGIPLGLLVAVRSSIMWVYRYITRVSIQMCRWHFSGESVTHWLFIWCLMGCCLYICHEKYHLRRLFEYWTLLYDKIKSILHRLESLGLTRSSLVCLDPGMGSSHNFSPGSSSLPHRLTLPQTHLFSKSRSP